MSFAIYLFGYALVVGGVAWALVAFGVQTTYIVITCLILAGLGIMSAVSKTRGRDRRP